MSGNKIKTIRNWFVKIRFFGICSMCDRAEKCLKDEINAKVTVSNVINNLFSATLAIIPAIFRLLAKQLTKASSVKID